MYPNAVDADLETWLPRRRGTQEGRTAVVTLLGWIGALFALLAYAQTRVTRFRQIALLSSIALLTFNALLGIWSNVALELALAIVNLRRLVQLRGPSKRRVGSGHLPGVLGQAVARFQQ
jgi:hypothetical protein